MSYGTPPPPPQYGAGAPAGGQPQGTSPMAIASLVLGIVGIVSCGCLIFSILAIVFGQLGKKEIATGAKAGEGLAKWGFILGIIGLVLGVLYWIVGLSTGFIGEYMEGDLS